MTVIVGAPARGTAPGGPRLSFLRALADTVRALDNTRLVTAALEHHYDDAHTIVIDDPLGNFLDVVGNNEYLGWYDGPPEKATASSGAARSTSR